VWVQGVDLHGKGFGADACDSAGLYVQEFGSNGQVVAQHPKTAVTKAGAYQELSITFTTHAAAAKVRFVLDTVLACKFDQGHVTYDDCAIIPVSGK
jgi:hypothetical protein